VTNILLSVAESSSAAAVVRNTVVDFELFYVWVKTYCSMVAKM
jgi:hypothetical protein